MNKTSHQQFCTFYLDKYYFGIEVERVQEIIRYQEITPVALSPDVVEGLINLRGQIVTAIDLRRLLELPERSADCSPMNIVVRTEDCAVSLLADRIGDVLELPDDSFEEPPDNLDGAAKKLIERAYKLDGILLLTMDTEKVVSTVVMNEKSAA